MALIECPECGGQNSSKNDVCVHCGHQINTVIGGGTILKYAGIAFFFFLVFKMCTAKPSADSTADTASLNAAMLAYNLCMDDVKSKLKSPSTAKFPSLFDRSDQISADGNIYTINSWVDSQNGFGSMIRSKWKCVRVVEGEYTRLISIEVN